MNNFHFYTCFQKNNKKLLLYFYIYYIIEYIIGQAIDITKGILIMKIVNEKGKLFGIINVIDLVVILVIALVAVAAVYKFAAPAAGEVIAPKSDMTVTMRVRGAMDYLEAEVIKLQPGERLIMGSGYVDAELVSVESVPYLAAATSDAGQFITAQDPQKHDLLITIKAKQAKDDPILKIGTQEIRIGRGFTFKTQTVEVNAIIEKVEFDG